MSQQNNKMSTPPSLLSVPKMGKQRPFKVLLLGQAGVGKTALAVRFITKRFIGEYDPTLEKKYAFTTEIGDESIPFEIMDTAAQDPQADSLYLDEHIRWADAFVLVFCTTDRCSLDHLTHLRFHISHRSKVKRKASFAEPEIPVLLVGNKNDLNEQRLVSQHDGRKKAEELGCAGYYDISVRESYQDARDVFVDLYCIWKSSAVNVKKQLKRQEEIRLSPPSPRRRDQRSSLFKQTHSSSTDSDTATAAVPLATNTGDNRMADKAKFGLSDKSLLDIKKEVKRKPSVHKRIMMKVMPSFKVSKDTSDCDPDPT